MEMAGSLLILSGLAEFLETVLTNVLVFWNITPCRMVGRYRRFGIMDKTPTHALFYSTLY